MLKDFDYIIKGETVSKKKTKLSLINILMKRKRKKDYKEITKYLFSFTRGKIFLTINVWNYQQK